MGKIINLPDVKKVQQKELYFVTITVSRDMKDCKMIRIDASSNVNEYHKEEIVSDDIFQSHFDMIFDRAKEEMKRFMATNT